MPFRTRLALPLLLLSVACSSYANARPLDAVPMPADPENRFEIWSGVQNWELHALRIDGDTVRGVRWWHDPACDSCQVAVAKSSVDSVRVLKYDGGKTGALALLVVPIIIVWYVVTVAFGGEGGG